MLRKISTESLSTALKAKRVVDLKSIAEQSGVNISGNKPDLVDRLVTRYSDYPQTCSSVLSFDLGYRNLAYCHLSSDATILDWARVDLDLPSFHPSVIAPVVRQFIKDKVQHNLKTTDMVVVEQQRARTGGAFTVLESTLRVNCVEAVLWTGLHEAVNNVDRSHLKIVPLLRQMVDRTWQTEINAVIEGNTAKFSKIKAGYYHKKQAGTLLVQKWLDENTMVNCSDQFRAMYAEEKKKDDLSDCLIQALAWYKWEAYSREFIHHFNKTQEIKI